MKKNLFITFVTLLGVLTNSCQKENGGGQGADLEDIKSHVASVYVVDTDIAIDPDGFNMLTDGGFERENWKTNTLFWHPEEIESSDEPCTGNNSVRLFYDGEGWRDLAIQSINVKKGQSYTLSLKFRGAWKGLNCYMGFRATEGHDVCVNDPNRNDEWDEGYTFKWDNYDDTKADVFFGGWWWYGLWVELDDMVVIPSGSINDSFMPKNGVVSGNTIPSAAASMVTASEKTVISSDASVGMMHNAIVNGTLQENVYVTYGFNKAGSLVVATAETVSVNDFVPCSAIKIDGTAYVQGYSGFVPGTEETECTITGADILSSTDGKQWSTAVSFSDSSKFAKVSFCQKGDYVYLFGSPIKDGSVNTYVARVAPSKLANVSEYEYWDGGEYVKGTEEIASSIFYGPTDCMSVVYNEENYAYMAIYRSRTTGQLVYRDAGLAEGEWSGEKLLVADPTDVQLYAPQVIVNQSKHLELIASAKKK